MAISTDALVTDIVPIDDSCQIQYIADYVDGQVDKPVIVRLSDGRFAVFYLAYLIEMLEKQHGTPFDDDVLWSELSKYPDFLKRFITEAIDVEGSFTLGQANKLASLQPLGLVVALEDDFPIGLVDPLQDTRSGGGLPAVNYDLIRPASRAMVGSNGGALESPAALESVSAPAPRASEPGTLSAGSKPAVEPRLVNIELLDGGFNRHDPAEKPLEVGEEYMASLYIDKEIGAHATEVGTALSADIFEPDQDEVILTVRIESSDFKIDVKEQQLAVPRAGKSKELNFSLVPQRDGPGVLNIVFLKDGAFVQVNSVTFHVGELPGGAAPPTTTETMGFDLGAAAALQPRDINLTIIDGLGGYQMILSGSVTAVGNLPITKAALHAMIAQMRKTLKDIVYYSHNGGRIYQSHLKIPKGVDKQTLPMLANAGYDLFHKLFIYNMDEQTKTMGKALKQLAQKTQLKLQIVSKDFTMPWGLLYVGDNPDEPDPEMFLGLKHVIEHIPLQHNMRVMDPIVNTGDGFRIALNVNKDIDTQMGQPIIGRQIDFWNKLAADTNEVTVDVRENIPQVMSKMNDEETDDDLLYFYCHALSFDISETADGGPDNSKLVLTGHQELTLSKMQRADKPFPGSPLIFLNACESAELSPQFYYGFVPYFMSKGARGVIGTEVETPALFAEEFAYRFFKRFLGGQVNLGQLFLDLRKEFYEKENNIMGLLYALYVDGDTRVTKAIT